VNREISVAQKNRCVGDTTFVQIERTRTGTFDGCGDNVIRVFKTMVGAGARNTTSRIRAATGKNDPTVIWRINRIEIGPDGDLAMVARSVD